MLKQRDLIRMQGALKLVGQPTKKTRTTRKQSADIRFLEAYPEDIDMRTMNRPTTDDSGRYRDEVPDAEKNMDLLACAKLGDVNAFNQLVGQYRRGLFSTILRITKHREDTEDIMQEALLRAYTHLNTFRGESRFSTWLTRIAVNQALMCLRARRRSIVSLDCIPLSEENSFTLDLPDSRPNPEQYCRISQLEETLHRLINKLPSSSRSVFVMRYLHEWSTEETANTLKISVAATKSRLLRARRHLQRQLGQNHESFNETEVQ